MVSQIVAFIQTGQCILTALLPAEIFLNEKSVPFHFGNAFIWKCFRGSSAFFFLRSWSWAWSIEFVIHLMFLSTLTKFVLQAKCSARLPD